MFIDPADLLRAAPWLALPLVGIWRSRGALSLEGFPAVPSRPTPLVSVIVPARNESRNIATCVRSILATGHPALELIVVDDHSVDDTAALARAAAPGDRRLHVMRASELPPGWFGKQWACATGAGAAGGELLLFADADTVHAPDLVPRMIAAQRHLGADLLSVAGRQVLGSFWERLIQPQIFAILFIRFGGTRGVNTARRAADVIANGQCLMLTREAYDAVGGHAVVRETVAEDLMLAQTVFSAGRRVRLVLGTEQLSTRMYTSLRELLAGWGKNVYAGGIDAMPFGTLGRLLFPLLFLLGPAMMLYPVVVLGLVVAGAIDQAHAPAAAIAAASLLGWWGAVYAAMDESPWYALLYPIGALMLAYIFVGALLRGRQVAWKGRQYVSRGATPAR